jgi:hypothetical protein
MKKDGSNVIQFPKPSVNKIEDMEEYDLETTYHIFDIVQEELEDLGYQVDARMKKDIAVLANLLYASFQRKHKNKNHVFHEILDECDIMIDAAKVYMHSLEADNNELDDGDPSNDNNRL